MAAEYNDAATRGRGDGAGSLRSRLAHGRPLVLDGATGTELERRGVESRLPLWSTHALLHAPEVVAAIHRDHAAAGADVVTANTFRTQARTLGRARVRESPRALCARAVALARRAGAPFVAGSMPPLEDCYRPELVPGDRELAREHHEAAGDLAAAGVDLLLVETHNCVREALAAARAARDTGLPVVVSFVSWSGARLLSGEGLGDALRALAEAPDASPDCVAVNCLPPSAVAPCLPLLAASPGPFGVYANLGEPDAEGAFERSDAVGPRAFAEEARGWIAAGARLVGGCCGTTPAHTAGLRAAAEDLLGES